MNSQFKLLLSVIPKSRSNCLLTDLDHFSTVPHITTTLTIKICLQCLKNCKSMAQLKQIQTQLFKAGLHKHEDPLKKIMVLCTDPLIGKLRYAEKIFDYIDNPSLFIYNVMIKAYAKTGSFSKVLFLFDKMRVNALWPDNFTYPFVFKAIGCLREVLVGQKIHGFVVKCGIEFDCYVCNSLMDMYAELGYIKIVNKLFDEMPERDLVSWNILISGNVRCNKFEDAAAVYLRMRQADETLRPDEATIVSTLTACIALNNLELGKEIHTYVIDEKLEFTSKIGNSLLDMYSKCGCLNLARQIFDKMPRKNVICWTSMVCGYVNCGELNEARALFEQSPVKDIVLWTAMINGYVQFNRVDEAISLFQKMQIEKVKPDKFTVVALLTGCAQLGALEQGKWIHEYMKENNIKIDAIAGTALIDMYAKCGCIEKSLEIFHELKQKDTASWTSIICSLAMNGKTSKALELFDEMTESSEGCFRPDDITFIGVLTACSHGGLVEEGRLHFKSMKTIYKIEPKVEHYGCLIDLLSRAGHLNEAEDIIMNDLLPMAVNKKNEKIIVPVYSAMLSACRSFGNVEMGERFAKRLVEIGFCDSSVHTLLANIYASAGRWDDAKKVRRKMRESGVKKEPGCSLIEVNGDVHEFLVGDMAHPQMREIYLMLDSVAKPLSLCLDDHEMEQLFS